MRSKPRFEVYRDRGKEWRWRLRANNGKIIADSGESYMRRSGAAKAAKRVGPTCNVAGFVYLASPK